MEIEIFEKKENVLFDRTEVKFYVLYEGEPTPKLLDVKSKLVALLDTKKECIVVDNIQPKYGGPKAEGYAKMSKEIQMKTSEIYKRCYKVFWRDKMDFLGCKNR